MIKSKSSRDKTHSIGQTIDKKKCNKTFLPHKQFNRTAYELQLYRTACELQLHATTGKYPLFASICKYLHWIFNKNNMCRLSAPTLNAPEGISELLQGFENWLPAGQINNASETRVDGNLVPTRIPNETPYASESGGAAVQGLIDKENESELEIDLLLNIFESDFPENTPAHQGEFCPQELTANSDQPISGGKRKAGLDYVD